ncbi:sugar kinase [Amycolatopsis jiangsuensis]|uniref:2-dehydro-3-deoxygluconokinase n=1 Tax=Amycolatopsis jiangsuensis TaxID=1181879 RepID=A0A840INN6_9PSEU|nr:sugar kinase [Amycolatopsis jiangsuensis]MBB4682987.1 2-dehydro-3-deoxygluconokinase [Amycolatopsis jiangsuensis]
MTTSPTGAPEVLCIGESMALFVPAEPGPPDEVRTWLRTVGGAESNVASHLPALGVPSAWVSAVGDDPFGRAIVREIAAAGVHVGAVVVDPARPTGLYLKESGASGSPVRYYRSGSAASGMGPELIGQLDFSGVRVLHLSGITPALSDSCEALVRALLDMPRDELLVSFDVNHRPALWTGRDLSMLRELAGRADIVLTGDDEAERVWGTGDALRLRELLPGPHTLVVKHGEHGATLAEGDEEPLFAPALRVDVVEPVGAGDAFAAGFLAATLQGADPRTRLRRGHLQAAATLLTQDDVGVPLPQPVITALLTADAEGWGAARLTGEGVLVT